eukprot:GHVP01049853.1.p1 GENE.GHVP01049853.1~~GHVP01049853.1.p1  ORF type:complete len:375 (-),score=83.05 GHVP01049853.1:1268-2392(-)
MNIFNKSMKRTTKKVEQYTPTGSVKEITELGWRVSPRRLSSLGKKPQPVLLFGNETDDENPKNSLVKRIKEVPNKSHKRESIDELESPEKKKKPENENKGDNILKAVRKSQTKKNEIPEKTTPIKKEDKVIVEKAYSYEKRVEKTPGIQILDKTISRTFTTDGYHSSNKEYKKTPVKEPETAIVERSSIHSGVSIVKENMQRFSIIKCAECMITIGKAMKVENNTEGVVLEKTVNIKISPPVISRTIEENLNGSIYQMAVCRGCETLLGIRCLKNTFKTDFIIGKTTIFEEKAIFANSAEVILDGLDIKTPSPIQKSLSIPASLSLKPSVSERLDNTNKEARIDVDKLKHVVTRFYEKLESLENRISNLETDVD